jgi:hypothetical protein
VHEEEDDDAEAQQDRDRLQQSLHDVAKHVLLLLSLRNIKIGRT